MFGRRPKPPRDWFTCPVCGAQVPVGASACRECASDENTGWSGATEYDDLDLPEPDFPDTFEEFVGAGSRRRVPAGVVVAILLGALLLAVAARFARLL